MHVARGPVRNEQFGHSLLRLGARLYRLQIEALETSSVPISFRQFRILERVDHGVSSMTELANLARRRLSTVSKSVDSLVRQGLLTRQEAPQDRRTVRLSVTPAGAEVLREVTAAMDDLASWLAEIAGPDMPGLVDLVDSLYAKAGPRLRPDAGSRNGPRKQ